MKHHDYIPELDGPQGRVTPDGRMIPGKGGGGSLLGTLAGAALGFMTGGATFGLTGALGGGLGGALAGGGLGGTLGGLLDGQQKPKDPTINIQQAPAAPESQAAKAPSASAVQGGMMGTGQAGGAPGVAQTMLTGAGGIDPKSLLLGKNSLLGQ